MVGGERSGRNTPMYTYGGTGHVQHRKTQDRYGRCQDNHLTHGASDGLAPHASRNRDGSLYILPLASLSLPVAPFLSAGTVDAGQSLYKCISHTQSLSSLFRKYSFLRFTMDPKSAAQDEEKGKAKKGMCSYGIAMFVFLKSCYRRL